MRKDKARSLKVVPTSFEAGDLKFATANIYSNTMLVKVTADPVSGVNAWS
jgi:hypothetical protein